MKTISSFSRHFSKCNSALRVGVLAILLAVAMLSNVRGPAPLIEAQSSGSIGSAPVTGEYVYWQYAGASSSAEIVAALSPYLPESGIAISVDGVCGPSNGPGYLAGCVQSTSPRTIHIKAGSTVYGMGQEQLRHFVLHEYAHIVQLRACGSSMCTDQTVVQNAFASCAAGTHECLADVMTGVMGGGYAGGYQSSQPNSYQVAVAQSVLSAGSA